MAKIFAPTSPEMSEREKCNFARVRRIAAEGMVLLENNGVLPLAADGRRLALFGSGVRRMVKGGTGSGDVYSRSVTNVEQGLKAAGFEIGTTGWLDRFDEECASCSKEYMDRFQAVLKEKGAIGAMWAMDHPYRDPDVPAITVQDMDGTDRNCAIYVLARTSGEGADRKLAPGDYELTEREKENLTVLTGYYEHTVVVLNVGGVIDTEFLRTTPGIDAVLLMSQPGCAAGLALADVLTGKASPDGRLAATWAQVYTDYPDAKGFSYLSGDLDDSYYRESIYVGYRYFDSFNVQPAYPFGFGCSYTTFMLKAKDVAVDGETVRVNVAVQNTGSRYVGRETVQVYVSQPQGKLDKPYQVLAGFAKTSSLAPGQSETVTVTFPLHTLASYDEEEAVCLLEKGIYYVRVGVHSRSTRIVAALELGETVVTARLQNRLQPDCAFETLHADPDCFYTYSAEAQEKAAASRLTVDVAAIPGETSVYGKTPQLLCTEKEQSVTMQDVLAGRASLEDLVAQLTPQELAELVVGSARGGFGATSVIGVASAACPGAAGDTTSALLESRGVQNLVLADGPAGLRLSRSFVADSQGNIIPGLGESAFGNLGEMLGIVPPPRPIDAVDHYQYCTAIPIATMLAQTWDLAVIEEAGDIVGGEMEDFGVTLWLAPGMNIQRNPLCGRNFEYYSEDPLLSGLCAAADTRGVQRHPGCGTTIKHFALNNQEDNRNHNNAHCTERALREIYLKGFEIAVRTAKPLALMSSYNLVNGVHSANNKKLLTDILRDEWGFEGLVMTDWGTTDPSTGFKYGSSSAAGCVLAGNDLTMPGSQQDVDDILGALKDGRLPLAALQQCALRVLALAVHCEQARENIRS